MLQIIEFRSESWVWKNLQTQFDPIACGHGVTLIAFSPVDNCWHEIPGAELHLITWGSIYNRIVDSLHIRYSVFKAGALMSTNPHLVGYFGWISLGMMVLNVDIILFENS